MRDNPVPFGKNAQEIIADAAREYHFPLCFDFPAGHIEKNNAIKLGSQATIEVKHDGVIFKQIP